MKKYIQPAMNVVMTETVSLICVSPIPNGGSKSTVTAESQIRMMEEFQADAEGSEEDLW